MLAVALPNASAKDDCRASMRLLLQRVYGKTYPYSVTSRVGGILVTGTVTRHAIPYRHATKPDAVLFEVTPAFEAALNDVAAIAKLPTPHRERLEAYQAALIEPAPEDMGGDSDTAAKMQP